VVEKERRIAALVERPAAPEGPDDLTRIRGIGPKIAAILHGLGITTFRDIAAFTDDDVHRVGAHMPVYAGRIIDDDWIGQARTFAG
jgi:predicted flap endonuclease-1-like 5' DNA nuclease